MRVNSLYGRVRSGDARSLALFAGFVVAFHLLTIPAPVVPLAMRDPDHAPLYGWTGHLVRWVPLVPVIGAVLFACRWHARPFAASDMPFVSGYSKANEAFATNAALHQREVSPSGFVTRSTAPPGRALGSPVKTKQFSFERLVS